MRALEALLQGPVFESIGWALIHLTWQATLVALLLAAINGGFRPTRAGIRYSLACAAMFLIAVLPVVTAYQHYQSIRPDISLMPASGTIVANNSDYAFATVSEVAMRGIVAVWKQGVYQALTASVPWLLMFWLAGVMFFSSRLFAAWLSARALTRSGIELVPAYAERAARKIAESLGLQRNVRVLISKLVEVPSVIGYFRPVILLPASCVTGLSIEQLETILAHELAHIRRYDFVLNFLQTVVETLFFYHPAVWWISAQIRDERENACDDLAVAVCGDVKVYAHALTLLEQLRPRAPQATLAATGGCLLARIKRLLNIESPREQFSTRWLAGVSLLSLASIAALLLPFSLAAQANRIVPAPERVELAPAAGESIDVVADRQRPTQESEEGESEGDDADGDVASNDAPSDHDFDFEFEFKFDDDEANALAHSIEESIAAEDCPSKKNNRPAIDRDALRIRAEKMAARIHELESRRQQLKDTTVELSSLSHAQIERLAALGVNVKLIHALAKIGCDEASLRQLEQLSNAGVDARYLEEMSKKLGSLDIHEFVHLRHLGVDPKYVAELAAQGIRDLDAVELGQMKAVGVTGEFAREIRRQIRNVSSDDLVQLKALGVNQHYISELAVAGYKRTDVEEIIQLKALGVAGGWIESLRREGLKTLTVEDLVQLKSHGVSAREVARMSKQLGRVPTADEIIQFKVHGNVPERELVEMNEMLRRSIREAQRELKRQEKQLKK